MDPNAPVVVASRRLRAPSVRAMWVLIVAVLLADVGALATVDGGADARVDAGPAHTAPDRDGGNPLVSLPPITVPDITVPTVTVPVITVPKVTVPPVTVTVPRPVPVVSLKGKIIFESSRGSVPDPPTTGPITPSARGNNVWVMNADGSNQRPLTTTSFDAQPDLSPDGTHLAWIRQDNQVWRMEANKTDARLLATCPLSCSTPAWSPDGTRIAYVSYLPSGGALDDIIVMRADGSSPQRFSTPVDEYGVSWSPDGTQIATNAYAQPPGMHILDLATGAERRILSVQAGTPSWSPDGSRILWDDDHSRIVSMRPDGSDARQLTPFDHQRFGARWTPDGQSIIFVYFSGVAGRESQIGIMQADGSGERLLTDGTFGVGGPLMG